MEETKKITKEELTSIYDVQNALSKVVNQIGMLETEKHGLLHQVAGLNQDQEKIKQGLEKKYGSIDIDLQSGSFTVIEDKVVEEK
tara:strand:- start:339 stop:593 length:255 start_codon:yes stop_codon:yes gene_type:complete